MTIEFDVKESGVKLPSIGAQRESKTESQIKSEGASSGNLSPAFSMPSEPDSPTSHRNFGSSIGLIRRKNRAKDEKIQKKISHYNAKHSCKWSEPEGPDFYFKLVVGLELHTGLRLGVIHTAFEIFPIRL